MRIKLKMTEAVELKKARLNLGLSQYELADRLGWVRSKVKRIEKGEVSTIEQVDLDLLFEALNVSKLKSISKVEAGRMLEGVGVQGVLNPPAETGRLLFNKWMRGVSLMGDAGAEAGLFPKAEKAPQKNVLRLVRDGVPEDVFTTFELANRRVGKNQVFFKVVMKRGMKPDQLLGLRMNLLGYMGTIHGVENTTTQDPLRVGDKVVIMLWGEGISQQTTLSSESA